MRHAASALDWQVEQSEGSSMAQDVARLFKEATASVKSDLRGAIEKLETVFRHVCESGEAEDIAFVAEELARCWARRKSSAKAVHYAVRATKVAPERKLAWTTLAKTCELVASRQGVGKERRAAALYRATAGAFNKAASMTKDPEDKRWLVELAKDAARQGLQGKEMPRDLK